MIDSRALVDKSAKLAENVSIGPWTWIGPEVEIGEGTTIAAHVVIKGPTRIGKNNKIHQFVTLGDDPQIKGHNAESTRLEIGHDNIFREYCSIHRGSMKDKQVTRIGNDNYFMAYTHVAHDCVVGNHTLFSNNASIAGHVTIGDYVGLGGFVGIHQFCSIGAYSFAAGGSIIFKDVPPFVMISGHPATPHGLNTVGLERQGFSPEKLAVLKRAYKILFRDSLTLQVAITELKPLVSEAPEVQLLIDFLQQSSRGIVR